MYDDIPTKNKKRAKRRHLAKTRSVVAKDLGSSKYRQRVIEEKRLEDLDSTIEEELEDYYAQKLQRQGTQLKTEETIGHGTSETTDGTRDSARTVVEIHKNKGEV